MIDDEDDDAFEMPEEVVVPLTDELDLHTFLPREVKSVTEAYLEDAIEAGFTRVRIIHGRGIGVQRKIVRALLEKHPRVVSFSNAPDRGGFGATVAELAPSKDTGACPVD